MEKINSITEWFEFSNKFQKIEEKLEDTYLVEVISFICSKFNIFAKFFS